MDLQHRGQAIKDALDSRRGIRRGRRNRKARYRDSRFDNRTRTDVGYHVSYVSSLQRHDVGAELQRFTPLRSVAVETVCFDMQTMVNPEISGVEYQQGLSPVRDQGVSSGEVGRQCAYSKAKSILFRSNTSSPGPEAALNECPILLWLAKIAIRARTTLPQPNSGPEHSEAALRPLKDASASMPLAMSSAALKTLGLPISFWSVAGLSSIALSSAIRKP